MTIPKLTRRQLLAGTAGIGFLSVSPTVANRVLDDGRYRLFGPAPPFTGRYTYAQEASSLSVAWYETYNGEFQEAQNGSAEPNATVVLDPAATPGYVSTAPDAPVISLMNVLPGDTGTLVVGLLAEGIAQNVWFKPEVVSSAENGQNEPERKAEGVDTDGLGELEAAISVDLWYDTGLDRCDGERGIGDELIASGTLAELAAAYPDGLRLEFNNGGETCPTALPVDAARCIGFSWSVDAALGNHVQSDTVEFALRFVATSCDDDANPFLDGVPA